MCYNNVKHKSRQNNVLELSNIQTFYNQKLMTRAGFLYKNKISGRFTCYVSFQHFLTVRA